MMRNRYRRIVWFFGRVIASFIWWDLVLPRMGLRAWGQRTRTARMTRSSRAFRILAVQMGGVLIKVGQFLSTRVDVLPSEITTELAGLQDEVDPEQFDDIRRVAEAELGISLDEKYAWFEEQPLAAASLGQVHRARLVNEVNLQGSGLGGAKFLLEVVVKVQRPNIEAIVATDLKALQTVGEWLRRYPPIHRRADVRALLAEFTRSLYEEIDYLAEGRNAETFAANFSDDRGVYVPHVVWTHTTRRVLTLENVQSIKINDIDAIRAAGIDPAEVATRLLNTYLEQIFEDSFFHADPHPGNLFIYPLPKEQSTQEGAAMGRRQWQLTFIDFGMVGRVPKGLSDGLRDLLIAVGTRDAAKMVQAYQKVGILLPSADLELLEKAEAQLFERYWGKSMSELTKISPKEIHEFAQEFSQLLFSLPFQIPQDLLLLGRAVGILSGMCTGLNPQFNVWEHIVPFAEKMIAEQARGSASIWVDELKQLARTVLTTPLKLDSLLSQLQRGDLAVRAPDINKQIIRLEMAVHQVAGAMVFAALLLGGIQLNLGGQQAFSWVILVGAGAALLWTVIGNR